MNVNLNEIGNLIKSTRKKKGITQKSLAHMIGKTESMVSRYESGSADISVDTLNKIATSLECSIETFIGSEKAKAINDFSVFESYLKSLGIYLEYVSNGTGEPLEVFIRRLEEGNELDFCLLSIDEFTGLRERINSFVRFQISEECKKEPGDF